VGGRIEAAVVLCCCIRFLRLGPGLAQRFKIPAHPGFELFGQALDRALGMFGKRFGLFDKDRG
jgi:hypothetical protein